MIKRVLGIDPGTNHMGYGVVDFIKNNYTMVDMGVIHLSKIKDPLEKLNQIHRQTVELVQKYHPQEAAIEEPFFGKNVQSMLKLGRAQGVAIAAILSNDIPVTQYSAKKIKQSITGNGNASKEQVAGMLQHLLKLIEVPRYLDATDGLAIALCHCFQQKTGVLKGESYSSWDSFLKNNPGRIA